MTGTIVSEGVVIHSPVYLIIVTGVSRETDYDILQSVQSVGT